MFAASNFASLRIYLFINSKNSTGYQARISSWPIRSLQEDALTYIPRTELRRGYLQERYFSTGKSELISSCADVLALLRNICKMLITTGFWILGVCNKWPGLLLCYFEWFMIRRERKHRQVISLRDRLNWIL